MDGEEDSDATEGVCTMELPELEAWSAPQNRKDSQNMLFLTVEYVGESNEGFGSFETNDSTSFSGVNQDTTLSCLSNLDPIYAVNNKSVIVVNGGDSSGTGSACTSSLDTQTATPSSPLLQSLSSVHPVIVSAPAVPSENSSSTIIDPYSNPLSLPNQDTVIDLAPESASSSSNVNQQPRRIIINNICNKDGTALQLDSLFSFDGTLLPAQSSEMIDSRLNSSLDRVELVLNCSDEHGIPYTLDTGVVSLRPQMNSDSYPLFIPKGTHLVFEQGEDGEYRVRKSNLVTEDCFQDFVEADPRLLDPLSHQVQLSSLIDDLSVKPEEKLETLKAVDTFNAGSQIYIHESSGPSTPFSSVIIEDKEHKALEQSVGYDDIHRNLPEQIIRHRPVLAEKTFTLENKISASDDLIKANYKKSQELSNAFWGTDGVQCTSEVTDEHGVQAVNQKSMLSHAWTSLPSTLLHLNKFTDHLTGQVTVGVFTRKLIPKNTEFGPFEGLLMKTDSHKLGDKKKALTSNLEYIIQTDSGSMFTLDLTDDNNSNWMKFVRAARSTLEQNMSISQHGESLYLCAIQDIEPNEELFAWYSQAYAERRNLPLEPASKKLWNCLKCSKAFFHPGDVQKHLNDHNLEHDENEDISANVENCNSSVHTPALNSSEKVTGKMVHQCSTCKRVFPRNYSLKRHQLMHSQEKKLSCSKCSTKFSDYATRERHMRTVHRVEALKKAGKPSQSQSDHSSWNSWMCSKCSVMFNKPSLLSLHSLSHRRVTTLFDSKASEFRQDDGQFKCPECSVVFALLQNLVDHVSKHGRFRTNSKRKVDPSKPFRCLECFKGLANEERLQQHMLVHGSEESKPKQCTICLKRFLNNSALACHAKTHTNQSKVWDCPICKQTFEHVIALREHTLIHSNNGCFTCPFCKKLFSGYGPIRKHIRSFHNERPLKCVMCNHVFPTHDKLRMHMLRHSDHREFLCANCGKQFKRKDKLNEHMRRAHEQEHVPKVQKSCRVEKTSKQKKKPRKNQKKVIEAAVNDYERYVFKCHPCLQGFKRRGMLVNHLAKRHPNIPPEEVPELNLPIMKMTRDYFCQYCDKVYKSSSKRKAHILKCHPGSELPITKHAPSSQESNPPFTQTAGTETKQPQSCPWCYKQYATKAKLLQHQRNKHADKSCPEVRKGVKAKTSKPAVVEVATQNEPTGAGENIILAECTMTLLESLQEYQDTGVPNDCEPLKKTDCNAQEESSDLLSQAMSELVQDPDYRHQYLRGSDDLPYHQLDTPHIVVPKTVYTPYPPR